MIRDGRLTFDQAVDFDQALSFAAPEVFDPVVKVAPVIISSAPTPRGPFDWRSPCGAAPGGLFTSLQHDSADQSEDRRGN